MKRNERDLLQLHVVIINGRVVLGYINNHQGLTEDCVALEHSSRACPARRLASLNAWLRFAVVVWARPPMRLPGPMNGPACRCAEPSPERLPRGLLTLRRRFLHRSFARWP